MQAVRVSGKFSRSNLASNGMVVRSIYQDIPLYALEEFKQLAPEAARSEEVLQDEHQLMLNRLSFELAERQRYAMTFSHGPASR